MQIINWLKQKYLRRRVERETQKLTEIRTGLRKLQSGSPQLRSTVQPELTRVDELKKKLRKVRSREDLRRWRSLYKMCLPAFQAALNLVQPNTSTGKRRTKSRAKK